MALLDLFRSKTEFPQKSFGYGVVGLGHIAGYFLDALRDSPTCTVAALVSGDSDKAGKLAKKYRVAQTYGYAEFHRIADDRAINAVYIALPVSMHREFTERAAAAGKHVLCEKPMAPNSKDARAMIEACAAAGVKLSIAYRCPHTSIHQRLRDLVQSGMLGPMASVRIESGFGFALDPGWRDNPSLAGGGSLYDVGIYPLNAARFLLGEDPVRVEQVHASCDDHGLERSISWSNHFACRAEARCSSSYAEKIPDALRVTGEHGSLLLAPAFSHRERYRLRGELRDPATGTVTRVDERRPADEPSEFRLEAEELARAVAADRATITPGEDGLADMIAMESIYAAAGVRLP